MLEKNRFALTFRWLSIFLTIAASISLVGYILISSERIKLKKELIYELSREYPWIGQVVWFASPDWVPFPGENVPSDPITLLKRIYQVQEDRIATYRLIREDTQRQTSTFEKFILTWSEQIRLCDYYYAQAGNHLQPECLDYYLKKMDEYWVSVFKTQYFENMYFYLDRGHITKKARQKSKFRYCNLSPLSSTLDVAKNLASSDLVYFYRDSLDMKDFGSFQMTSDLTVEPGDCVLHSFAAFDIEPRINFYARAASMARADWVDAALTKAFPSRPQSFLSDTVEGFELCSTSINGDWAQYKLDSCYTNTKLFPYYPYASGNLNSGYQAVSIHPLLNLAGDQIYEPNLLFGSVLHQAQNDARYWAEIVNAQYELHQKWLGRAPHFYLDADIDDTFGPLSHGVSMSNMASEDLYGEKYDIPAFGKIIGINGRYVWSIYDIYESLHQHGISREAGIGKPLQVLLANHNQSYGVRYKFNTNHLPGFIENTNGFIEGFEHDITYGQEWLACGAENTLKAIGNTLVKAPWAICKIFVWLVDSDTSCGEVPNNIFNYEDIGECSWKRTQQYAFAMQEHPTVYNAGQIISWFIPVGTNTLRVLKGQKLAKSNYVVRAGSYGMAEMLDNSLIEIGSAPPGKPLNERFDKLALPAGIGFVAGALFHPKVKVKKTKNTDSKPENKSNNDS